MNDGPKILVIDDDEAIRSSLSLLLRRAGYSVVTADDHKSAVRIVAEVHPDLFILDMNFSVSTSGEEGLALLADLRTEDSTAPIILITAWGSIPLAVAGMKAGANDFITKPWNNDQILKSVRTALLLSSSDHQEVASASGRDDLDAEFDFEKLVGHDEKFVAVLRTVARVCGTDASILIQGASGTGKELIAEAIHINSSRRDGPFVPVNLGGVPSTLFETEMFGHKKGAFTDARQDRVGRFMAADGGTIFLDEIGDLDSSSQVKLLRVVQDRVFERVGDNRALTSDFRLVCATNKDLERLVAAGGFREDLYYRINLIRLKLPSLSERRSDIPVLIEHFTESLKTIYNRTELRVSRGAIDWLTNQEWPGNVRQLKNTVERAVLVSSADILDTDDFKRQLDRTPGKTSSALPAVGSLTLDQMEESMIRKALQYHAGNHSRTARALGLSRSALYRRLEKYGITE